MKLLFFALSFAVATGGPALSDYSVKPVDVDVSRLTESKTLALGGSTWLNVKKQLKGKAAPQVIPTAILPESVAPQFTVPEYWPVVPDLSHVFILPEAILPNPGVATDALPEGSLPRSVASKVIPEPADKLGVPASQVKGGFVNDDSETGYDRRNKGIGGVYTTFQSWFDGLLNFVNDGVRYTHQFI